MFSLFQRKPQEGVDVHIHRICDLTAPNMPVVHESRSQRRYNRAIPVVILPWRDGKPQIDQMTSCLTNDLSDEGISLFVRREIEPEILIGFWLPNDGLDEPWFFRAKVRSVERTGAGLWRYGTHVVEFMNRQQRKSVLPLFDAAREQLTFSQASVASI